MSERGRRDEILHAARMLFREKGFHATTIRDIAEKAGMLSGSLYAHIKTKEDLLFEITDDIADEFLAGLQRVVSETGRTAEERFRNALAQHIAIVAENLDAAVVFSHEWKALSKERRALIQEKRDAYERLWAQVIEHGVATGEFRVENVRFARTVTLSVANWLYQWYDPNGELDVQHIADRLATVLLQGIHR